MTGVTIKTTLANKVLLAACCAAWLALLPACKQEGPLERAGEEIDEAARTVKNGKESTSDKLDDAADEVRDAVKSDKKK
jgi:hypothetical protein